MKYYRMNEYRMSPTFFTICKVPTPPQEVNTLLVSCVSFQSFLKQLQANIYIYVLIFYPTPFFINA